MIKYKTLATTNICKTTIVSKVDTYSNVSVKTGGIINTSEMRVLLTALTALSAAPVNTRPSLEPTSGLTPCWRTARID